MAVRKKEGADLRKQYPLYVQIGLVLSLTLLIVAFRVNMSTQSSFEVQMEEQETVDMKQIQQTQQEKEPPPPPKPPVPQEVPNDEVIEQDDVDFDASLDMDQKLDVGEGPPGDGEEEEEEQEIFMVVENQPELKGGMKALQESVEYPEFAKKAGIEGRVIVQFVVNEQGNVQNPKVTRGVHKLLNEEAIKAVKEQSFKPGKQRGEAVKVQMSLPVTFRLQ
ncbi:MAG: energy transducer TonB [Bacteroidetes bacterium SW_11_64_17]|jgi:protein TonB|nr:MAG: energy transducer TonB [Bacteroidetes bacterium SW_11_64_17]